MEETGTGDGSVVTVGTGGQARGRRVARPAASDRVARAEAVARIPLGQIRLNLANPRKAIDEQELAELAASIREHGLLQPILVRTLTAAERRRDGRRYQIVIGARRYFAAERAGLAAIDCYVREMSSDEALVASFLDHAHHRTLTDSEEADFLRYLRSERGMRLREIAALLQKSIAYVSRRLGVFGSPELQGAVRDGRITQAAAQEILRAPEAKWGELAERAAGLTRAQVRALVDAPAAESPLSQPEEPGGALPAAGPARAYDEALRRDGPVRRRRRRRSWGWSATGSRRCRRGGARAPRTPG
jgi:ParB family chromosome partitioning protein